MKIPKHIRAIRDRAAKGPVICPENAIPRIKKISGVRAVVFDIYGTLISSGVGDISLSSKSNSSDALLHSLSDHGIKVLSTSESKRLYNFLLLSIEYFQRKRSKEGVCYPEVEIRQVWKYFLEKLVTKKLINPPPADLDIEGLIIEYECRVNPTQPMPGLVDTLNELHQRGLKISIISNAQFYTPLLFDALIGKSLSELNICMDCAIWSYILKEGKPSQRLYESSANHLFKIHQIDPNQVLYVGNDMRNDIWPAQSVGFKTALFAGDKLSLRRRKDDPQYKRIEADLEITQLHQLLDCL